MDWVLGSFHFRGRAFRAWHFDVRPEDGSDEPELSTSQRDNLELASEEIGAVLWSEAAEACLLWLQRSSRSFKGWKVLELGSGCGYVGLALAADGAEVMLTDMQPLHPLLRINTELALEAGYFVRHCTLDWCQPVPPNLRADYDLVIGCDLLYDSASPSALLGILQQFVTGDTEFRLSVNLRDHGQGLRKLLGLMERDFICNLTDGYEGVSLLLARRR
mmetsp:Transcript_36406/g.102843  ORF Transcript_36406/g.102843 Transcript_36406/m.102843 type:complete len:218 (-) Transcript_36406:8-661(-)